MTIRWTSEQILALAPDASSAKAGKDLATPRKWVTLGRADQVAWGECQGSGAAPYRTQIDLNEPAFRCSCPSRKFPCKHGLGLLLLLQSNSAAFEQTAPPAWVAEWMAARAKRAEQRSQREERASSVNPAAQAQRSAARFSKIAAGIDELERWLHDLIRQGLASAHGKHYNFWETPAARMVDAQAPGLARLLRDIAGLPASGVGWEARMLERLSRLYLLIEGFRRMDDLSPETQADIRSSIGLAQSQDEVLANDGIHDDWLVMGRCIEEEDRLQVQRSWLWGMASQRPALLLDFAAPGQMLDKRLLPGTLLAADLAFYAGAYPLRALVKHRHAAPQPFREPGGAASIAAAIEAYAAALSRNPWLERFPLLLREVVPLALGDRWGLRDADGHLLPIVERFERGWRMLAISGGYVCGVFGEWDGDVFLPLSMWIGGVWHEC